MTHETILIALGGNAIDPSAGNDTFDAQWEAAEFPSRARPAASSLMSSAWSSTGGTHAERPLDTLLVGDAEGMLAEGQFHEGTMGLMLEAAIRFVRWKGREAVIGPLDRFQEALEGTSGTRIVPG